MKDGHMSNYLFKEKRPHAQKNFNSPKQTCDKRKKKHNLGDNGLWLQKVGMMGKLAIVESLGPYDAFFNTNRT